MENKKNKKSLSKIFLVFFLSLFFLFTVLIFSSFIRLNEYKNILNTLSNQTIPKIIDSTYTYTKITKLIYLSEKLTKANTQAFRTLTYSSAVQEILIIKELRNELSKDNKYLLIKINSIEKEIDKLNSLIKQKLLLQEEIEEKLFLLKSLNQRILRHFNKDKQNNNSLFKWRLNFDENLNLTYQALNSTKLNILRQNIFKQKKVYKKLTQSLSLLPKKKFSQFENFTKQTSFLIFGIDGLLELRAKQLKINGRARGRGNFANNLVLSFYNDLEYDTLKYTKKIKKQILNNVEQAKDELHYVLIIFVLLLIYLFLIIYYLNKVVVRRLIVLDENVNSRIQGNEKVLTDKREDEISYITQSFNYFANKIQEQNKKLEDLSLRDALTNIANRRSFDIKLANEVALIKRYDYKVSIILMDIDFFKKYNDFYGHLQGDKCLQKVSACLKKTIARDVDLVARYGGEEFVCVLSNCDEKNSKILAKKILNNIKQLNIPHEKSEAASYVSFSLGITTVNKEDNLSIEDIIEQADKALYEIKRNGRNNYIHHNDI